MLTGPKFVVKTALQQAAAGEAVGDILSGVMLLGDCRLLPMLEDAWRKVNDDSRMQMSKVTSHFITHGLIEFYLRCLEAGCSEGVFATLVAALVKMPVLGCDRVRDVKRALPAYTDGDKPIKVLRDWTFKEYLRQIQPRLDALARIESEPQYVPLITQVWQNPKTYAEVVKQYGPQC